MVKFEMSFMPKGDLSREGIGVGRLPWSSTVLEHTKGVAIFLFKTAENRLLLK